MPTPAPIACTLAADDYRERMAWIAELNRTALRSHEITSLTLTLLYDHSAEQRVRALVAKEQLCCAFLGFDLHPEGDLVRLTITAPEDARAAAATIFDQFLSVEAAPVLACGCS